MTTVMESGDSASHKSQPGRPYQSCLSALLHSCPALPKLSFLLRTVDTTGFKEQLQKFDRIAREGLTRIFGIPIVDRVWRQAKLPVAMGGLGLRGAEDHTPAAYAASILASQPLAAALQQRQEEGAVSFLSQPLHHRLPVVQGEEAFSVCLNKLTRLPNGSI